MNGGSVFMVGIGGIGMSALAQLYASRGVVVSGTDRDDSPTVALLRSRGIEVVVGSDTTLPEGVERVIYSDAVASDHPQRREARERGIPEQSYFQALGEISKGMRTIAVAGTHGKTTTTGMLASVLKAAGKEPTAIVGSIVRDFQSNFLMGRNDLLVVEACEYRNHLLELSPDILVITNVELDHTDFFPSLEALQETFRTAAERVLSSGVIVTDPSDPNIAPILNSVRARVADYTKTEVPELSLIGIFNRHNARAAKTAALAAFSDLEESTVDEALTHFKGSWRRFEYKGETGSGAMVFDDYAHHPTSVRKTIEAAREKYSDKKIVVAFHPHLYSRTRDFLEEFAEALSQADEVVLAPIYGAREEPVDGITSEKLAEKISALGTPARALPSLHDIFLYFTSNYQLSTDNLLITMGAGDIYKVADQLVIE